MVNHLNYIRYINAFPSDDIAFIFAEKVNASLSETRVDQKEEIMNRMLNFEVIKQDHAGISDNCLWELETFMKELENGKKIFKFTEICPSAVTFLDRNKNISDKFMPYWGSSFPELNITSIFK